VSPTLSLEDALAVLLLAKEGLGATKAYVSGRADDHGDDLLLKEDRNPNRKGLELAAKGLGVALVAFDELLQSKAKAVFLAGSEIPALEEKVVEWLAGRETVVALATHQGGIAAAAQVALPLAMHGEGEGTFVNFEGRAQRFLPAYGPKGR